MFGQFQSDHLEGEFGIYRQLAGGCYYISVEQVLCTARFREMELFLNVDALNDLPHTKSPCCEQPITDQEWEVIDDCVANISTISDQEQQALYFVAGYIAMKEGIKDEDQPDEHGEFTQIVSRGQLHHPPKWLFNFTQSTYSAFKILQNKGCAVHLINIFIQVFHAFFLECFISLDSICRRLCNCFMKGEVRRCVDVAHAHPEATSRKLRKLDSK
jgi:hypothetical protein